jgi:hypothetical protein
MTAYSIHSQLPSVSGGLPSIRNLRMRNVLVGRPEGKRPLGRPRRRWEDNIKIDLREIEIGGANWIQLAQDRVQWRAFVNTVTNLRLP